MVTVTGNTQLDEFADRCDTASTSGDDLSVVDQLLKPVSPSIGLRLIPSRGDPIYLQNRGKERYLFRDEHDRWFILRTSAKESIDEFVRWVYLPEDKPAEIARTALRQRTVVGYRYVQRSEAPKPVATTVTAMFVREPWPDTTYGCGSCGERFDLPEVHALHCWEAHPRVPNPEQVRLRRSADE